MKRFAQFRGQGDATLLNSAIHTVVRGRLCSCKHRPALLPIASAVVLSSLLVPTYRLRCPLYSSTATVKNDRRPLSCDRILLLLPSSPLSSPWLLQSASEQEHARRVRRELQQLQQTMMKDSKAKVRVRKFHGGSNAVDTIILSIHRDIRAHPLSRTLYFTCSILIQYRSEYV